MAIKCLIASYLLFCHSSVLASMKVQFGEDSSRFIDPKTAKSFPSYLKEIIQRSVVFIRKKDVTHLSGGRIRLKQVPYTQTIGEFKNGYCDDYSSLTQAKGKRNVGQFCSGFLDSDYIVHSASHCFSGNLKCDDFYIIMGATQNKDTFSKDEYRQCDHNESLIDDKVQMTGNRLEDQEKMKYDGDTSDKALLVLSQPFNKNFGEISIRASQNRSIDTRTRLLTVCGSNGFPLHSIRGNVVTVDDRTIKGGNEDKNIKTIISNIDMGAGCSGGGQISIDERQGTFRLEAVNSFVRQPDLSKIFPVGKRIIIDKKKSKKKCIESIKLDNNSIPRDLICKLGKPITKVISEDESTIIKEVTGFQETFSPSKCWSGIGGYSTQNYVVELSRLRKRVKEKHKTQPTTKLGN